MTTRGVTLAETLVALAILISIFFVILSIQQSTSRASRKFDIQTENFRNAAIAVKKIKNELRGSRLIYTGDPVRLGYRRPLKAGNPEEIVVGEGGIVHEPTIREIYLSDGHLYSSGEPLIPLGASGDFRYTLEGQAQRIVRVRVVADVLEATSQDPTKPYTLQTDIRLQGF